MSNNNIKFSIPLSGLFKREVYSYIFRGLGGNWPAIVSPLSGSFEAKAKTETLNGIISFCPSTGLCPQSNPNVLPYSLEGCGYDKNYLYTNIAVDVTSNSDNVTTRSNAILMSCSGSCLPEIDIKFSGCTETSGCGHNLVGRGNNSYQFISMISGLQPNHTYDYSIQAIGGNWPAVMLTPMSGSFKPHHETYNLDHKIMFCPSTTSCPSSTRGYLSYTAGQCFTRYDLSTSVQIKITPRVCDSEQIFSNQITVYCQDCLPRPTIVTPSAINLSSPSNNSTSFNSTISGLIPGQTYNYKFNNINSTWPTVIVPHTGSFIASDSEYTLAARALFCPSTGLCPSATTSGLMLPYTIYSNSSNLRREMSNDLLLTNIRLDISSTCDSNTYNSEPITLRCINCLPPLKYPDAEFASSSLTLTTGCCSGSYPLVVGLSNVFPGDSYRYSFTSSSDKIGFVPATGIVSFGTSGTQNINTILVNNLARDDRAIINISVTHIDSGFSDIDFMTISCAPTTC